MSGSTRKGSLPIEVLDLVFSHLPMPLDVYDLRIEYADADPLYGEEGEESRPLPQRNRWAHRDLLACALVSRSFSQAALPLLWKVIAAGEGFLLGDAALRTLTSMQSQSQREFYCSCVESLQLCLPHLIELQGSRTLEHLVRLRNVTFGKAQTNYTKRAELATPIDYSGLLNGRLLSLSISDTLVMKQVVHSGIFFEQLDILQIEIERDTVSEQDVEAFASFLAPCTELEEIVLWTSSMQYINPAVIKHIFSCGNLKYLSLNAHLDEEILDPILRSGSQKFVNLERAWICLPACYLPRVLSGSRSLRSLVINIIPGPALREGDALEGCERLETITIDHDPPTPSCCDYLRVFAECTNLRKLRVRDAANSAQPAISTVKLCSQIFSKLGRLEALECHRFEDAAMSILGHSCPMLTDLKTGFNGVSLPIIGAEVCFPMLKWLQVSTDEVENFSSIFCASYSASSEISWVRDRMFQSLSLCAREAISAAYGTLSNDPIMPLPALSIAHLFLLAPALKDARFEADDAPEIVTLNAQSVGLRSNWAGHVDTPRWDPHACLARMRSLCLDHRQWSGLAVDSALVKIVTESQPDWEVWDQKLSWIYYLGSSNPH